MAFSPNGFLNQVLSNGQEPIMGHVNIIAARPYLGLSGDKGLEEFKDRHLEGKWTLNLCS
jgi:hypothetical protein